MNRVSTGLWNGIIAASTPRVARENPLEGEPSTLEEAVFFDSFNAVVGAGGRIAAAVADKGRQRHLIDPNQEDQELSGHFRDASHG